MSQKILAINPLERNLKVKTSWNTEMSAEIPAVSAGCGMVSCFLHTSHYVFFLLAEARLESRLQSNWLMRLLGTGGSVNWMITATSLQILIGLMVIMSRLFLEGEGYTAAASAGPRAAEVCRAGPTLVILNVCRYVGCMKISWKCFEGRPLRGFYQMPSKYSEVFLTAIIWTKMSGYWSVSSLDLFY